MLIVLVGARGAGKSTLLDALKAQGVEVLQPSTTRARRSAKDEEYDFVRRWTTSRFAWSIQVGDHNYGMRKSELEKAKTDTCVTVFEPLNLHVFEALRRSLGVETLTVGLNTLADVAEQHNRVGHDAARVADDAELAKVTKIVNECDLVLSGDTDTIANAARSLIALVSGRGGVVTKEHLAPMIRAGALLTGADPANIRPASYDLRIGSEILCQGKVVELTEAAPRFEIPPYSYAIVSALEGASLPPCVIGRFDLKVSLFFEGVILSNGPQVDPGYKGALFCMLYNGSGQPKLLTLGRHFATIDFTTTTNVTEGYRQKYQLKQRMGQFLTDNAVTGAGGAIVDLVDSKVGVVDAKVRNIKRSFWTIAAAFIGIGVLAPAITIPVAWIEIDNMRTERLAMEDAQRRSIVLLRAAARERAESARLLEQYRGRTEKLPNNPTVLLPPPQR